MKSVYYPGLTLVFLFFLLGSCGQNTAPAPPKEITEKSEGQNAKMIRHPLAAEGEDIDTVNVAKMEFEGDTEYLFGEVEEGTVVEHTFHFKNVGNAPLLISAARSTCGCTVPEYPKDPIEPGESESIVVSFDTKNKYGRQRKPITLIANTYPSRTHLYMDGTILND